MLNRHNLSVVEMASRDASRFGLNAIHVTPEFTEASDGHIAIRVARLPQSDAYVPVAGEELVSEQNFMLPLAEAKQALKAIPVKAGSTSVAVIRADQNRTVSVLNGASTQNIAVPEVAATFPDLDCVIPSADGYRFAISVNPELLRIIADAAAKHQAGARVPVINMFFTESTGAITLEWETNAAQPVTALLMPVRNDGATERVREQIKAREEARIESEVANRMERMSTPITPFVRKDFIV